MKSVEFKNGHLGTTENNPKPEKIRLNKLLKEISGQDFYTRLGVKRGAKKEEINDAFRKKAKEFHPDTKPGELRDLYDKIARLYSEARVALAGKNGINEENGAELDPFSQWRQFFDPKAREAREAQLAKENPEIAKRAARYGVSMDDMFFRKRDVEAAEQAKDIILRGKVAVIVERYGAYYPTGDYHDEEVSVSTTEVKEFNSQEEAKYYMLKNAEPKETYAQDPDGPGYQVDDKGRFLHMALPGGKLFAQDKKYIIKNNKIGGGRGYPTLIPNGYYLVELTEEGRIGIPKDQFQSTYQPSTLIGTRESLILKVIKSEDILRLNNSNN